MRILVVRLSSLGDVVHTLPVVAGLRRTLAEARLDWLVDARYAPLVKQVPVVDTVITTPRRLSRWQGTREAVRMMRGTGYDVAIDLQGLLKSAVLARLSGAQRVIGFETAELREPMSRWLYSEQASVAGAGHVIAKNLAAVASLGVSGDHWEFPLRAEPSAVVEETRTLLGLNPGERFGLISPGSAWPSKCWDPLRFGELARRVHADHTLRSAVVWGPGERDRAETVAAASGGVAVPTPPTDMVDLLALSRAAALMVAGDTGPLHLAAAVGTPVVGIYGPSDPSRNGPWSGADAIVSQLSNCGCQRTAGRGVVVRRCRQPISCLAGLSVDEVGDAVTRRLAAAHA